MTCSCIPCKECGGSGTVFYSMSGVYLGNLRCDDLDDLGTCEECGGSGISEKCGECYDREDDENHEQEIKDLPGLNARQVEEVKKIIDTQLLG